MNPLIVEVLFCGHIIYASFDFSSRKDAIAAIMKYYTLTVKNSVQVNAKKSSGKCVVLGCTTVLAKNRTTSSSCPIHIRVAKRRNGSGVWYISNKSRFTHLNCMATAKPTANMLVDLPSVLIAVESNKSVSAKSLQAEVHAHDKIQFALVILIHLNCCTMTL